MIYNYYQTVPAKITNFTASSEEPPSSVVPDTVGDFSDVRADVYYADAVLWAVENGITSGTSATTFSPNNTCTTAQILTFLWRANGSPAVSGGNPFHRCVHRRVLLSGGVVGQREGLDFRLRLQR